MTDLLYIVRNDYEPKDKLQKALIGHNHSILGIFPSLKEAYVAGKKKWEEMIKIGEIERGFWMNIKVVKLGLSNYLGCSAWQIMWNKDYTDKEIEDIQQKIENWTMWKNFQYLQEEQRKAQPR